MHTKDDYLGQIFEKCVAAIVGSHNVRMNKSAFQYLVLLAELRMHETFKDLAELIRIQRRTQPTLADLMLWITRNNLDLVATKPLRGPHVEALNSLQFDFDVADLPEEEAVFFDPQLFQIKKIVQSRQDLPSYAPEWSPALPPDHTYMETANFSNEVRGLQELHEKLFEEGHLAELALQRLLGSKGSVSAIDLSFPGPESQQRTVDVIGEDPEPAREESEPAQRAVEHPDHSMEVDSVASSREPESKPAESASAEPSELSSAQPESTPVKTEGEGEHATIKFELPRPDEDVEMEDVTEQSPQHQTGEASAASEPDAVEPQNNENTDKVETTIPTDAQEDAPADPPAPKIKLNFSKPAPEKEEDEQPKSYITVVNSEPAPQKSLSLKINFKKPKKSKSSNRPRVDIEELARKHVKEHEEKQNRNEDDDSKPQTLDAYLQNALESFT